MARETVVVFHSYPSYPFDVGKKIRIEGGNRRGDWEVIGR